MRRFCALGGLGVALASWLVCPSARAEDSSSVERLKASTSGLAFEAPWRAGVITGLGGTPVTHDGARTTPRQLGWTDSGTIGFHAGVAANWSWLYTTASYDYGLLFEGASLQHAAVGAGLCLPRAATVAPFIAPTARIWLLHADGPNDTTWSSGFHASGALDLGMRITPFVGYGRHSRSPSLIGLTFHASIPVVGGGGVIATAAFTIYSD